MRTTLRLAGGELVWREGEDPGRDSRPLAGDDADRFRGWISRYRRGLHAYDRDAFLALGREMFASLDGDQGWIGRIPQPVTPPWIVEFAIPGPPGELGLGADQLSPIQYTSVEPLPDQTIDTSVVHVAFHESS